MINNDQKSQIKSRRSLTQEMRQVFAEWMEKLPFIRREVPRDPEREGQGEESADKASGDHPTDGTL